MTLEEYIRNQERKLKAHDDSAKGGTKDARQDIQNAAGSTTDESKDALNG